MPQSAVTGRRHLAALLLVASLALLLPNAAAAQGRDPSPSASELRDEYPLHSTPQPGGGEAAEPAPAATAEPPAATAEPPARPRVAQSSGADLRLVVAAVLAILAFVAGFALAVRPLRWRRVLQHTADPAPQATAAPPAPRRAWTAEIDWRPADGEACFRVVARPAQGPGTAVVAESARLEWPPTSPAAVAALTAAAEALEARLVAAGWRPLPPGDAWYAKRFAWEPEARVPPASGRFARRAARPEGSEALWRGDGSPPDHVAPISNHTGRAT
jgi:hypothetical protein